MSDFSRGEARPWAQVSLLGTVLALGCVHAVAQELAIPWRPPRWHEIISSWKGIDSRC